MLSSVGMKTFSRIIWMALLLVSASQAGNQPANEVIGVVAELRDGSKLVGTLASGDLALVLEAEALGRLSIAFSRIDKVEFGKSGTTATVILQKGDKLNGEVKNRPLKLQTLLGAIALPMETIAKLQVRASPTGLGRLLKPADWQALPFPENCDWPGERGSLARIDDDGLHLLGQPVRTTHSYKLPIDMDCEFVLLEPCRQAGNNLQIIIGQSGARAAVLPENMLQLVVIPVDGGESQLPTKLIAIQHSGDPQCKSGRVITEREGLGLLPVGQPNRLKIHATMESCQVTLNDKTLTIDGFNPKFAEVQIEFWQWLTASRWLVRNVLIRPADEPAR